MRELSELHSLLIETSITLCHKVREQLRAVKVDVDEEKKNVYFWYYYDGEISEGDNEKLETITDAVVDHVRFSFLPPYTVINNIQRLDYPRPLPVNEGYFVYIRDESIFKGQVTRPIQIDCNLYRNADSTAFDNMYLLSIYAILGRVRPNLRSFAVTINERKRALYFFFYFDGEISQEDETITKRVVDDVLTYFYEPYSHEISVERIDFPSNVPQMGIQIYIRDESVYVDEDSQYQKYAPKEWHDLQTHLPIVYKQQAVTQGFLYTLIRRALLGEIRSNWVAVQISVNQFKREVTLWIHTYGPVTDDVLEVAQSVKEIALSARYTAIIHTLSLDETLTVPIFGSFLFLREDNSLKIAQYKNVKATNEIMRTVLSEEVQALWRVSSATESYLRAVKIDVLAKERNFFIVFIFSGAYTREDEIKAKALAQKLNSQFFHGYNCQSYIARYDLKEPIPTIGRAVYLANEEMLEDEDTATLFYESVIEALAGKINQDLCAIKAEVDEFKKKAFFWFYYDSEPTEQHRLTAQAVADLSCPTGYTKILEVEHLTPCDKIPAIGRYIYRRFDL